jgi:hypothetical protein
MKKRQGCDPGDMAKINRKEPDAIAKQLVRNELLDRLGKRELAQTAFDRYFPATRETGEAFVIGVGNCAARSFGESFRIVDPPKQGVRIKQQLHQV